MTEVHATARLPHIDIGITRRRLPDEDAEYLEVSIRATPSIATAAHVLGPAVWGWLALSPFIAWQQTFGQALLAPWLALQPWAGRRLEGPRGDAPEDDDSNVHPFPDQGGRGPGV